MSTIGIILLVVFVIVSILLILLVLVQDDGQSGMGGLLGGRGTNAFGSHSASVLTKATAVLVFLFFALALILAIINKKPKIAEDLAPDAVIENTNEESAESSENAAEKADSWWSSSDAEAENASDNQ